MSTASAFRYHTETVNGIEIEKPIPKRLHAIVQARIQRMLEAQLAETAFEALPSLDLLCGNDRYVPDVVVARTDANYTNDVLDDGAYLAIEIMSPGQTVARLFEKCAIYLQYGTRVCWAIWPKRRRAWICTNEATTEVGENANMLDAKSLELVIEIPVSELFQNLPETGE